ncbi:MAG: hypothetical protein H6540_05950 [Bacteroidales bacterium]|nr:hypothetical protein [Bacteroidales bacterium]
MKTFLKISILLFSLFQAYTSIIAQEPEGLKDSLSLKNSSETRHKKVLRTNLFFDNIRSSSANRKWMNELQNVVILPPQSKITDTIPTLRGDLEFLSYDGFTIRSIRFIKLDVFASSINDTIPAADSWLKKTANSVHVNTSDRILRRHLLFTEGDRIDPRILADNVRIFRDLSYIEDARIIVDPVADMPGYADIIFVVKDQWSMAFYLELSSVNSGRVELWDRNIFGTGNEIQNNLHWDTDKPNNLGYEAIYNTRNIYGSFIDGRFYYSHVFDSESYGLQFNRKFFTPNTKYAGGAAAYHQSSVQNIWNPDSGYFKQVVSFNSSDIWIGRAFKLNKNAMIDKNRLNLILASRFYKLSFFDRPEPTRNLYYNYQDKSVWLNTIALSAQSFYQSNLIYSYGRTEDIPIGSLLNFTMGPEFGEFENRFYTSLSYARGNYLTNLGYLYFKINEGGFITNSGNFEQAVFQFQLKYFSNLFIFGQFKFRQFINFGYTKGIKRYEDDRLTINDKYGLRGFNEPYVYGQQRFTMNWESVAFSPWYVYGFRFTFFGYIDFALLGPENSSIIYQDVYTGIGIGTRIKNERLVFPTFSFRFGFFPNLQNIPLGDRMHFSGEPRLKPNNFYLTNPGMVDYQ